MEEDNKTHINLSNLGTLPNYKYDLVLEKINNCGNDLIDVVSPEGEIKEIVKYCDNRACDNPACMVHRRYQYLRNHGEQIDLLNKSIRSPKAWLFTGWVLPYPIDKKFCQDKLKMLFRLLKHKKWGAVTEFSIHMEIKLKKNGGYLHFHVVCGGLKDMFAIEEAWSREVYYEYAICKEDLEKYVSKYASKTPKFVSENEQYEYIKLIYKMQTTRFSCGKKSRVVSGWYLLSQLEWEVCRSYRDDNTDYHSFVDSYKHRKLERKRIYTLEDFDLYRWFPVCTLEDFKEKIKGF